MRRMEGKNTASRIAHRTLVFKSAHGQWRALTLTDFSISQNDKKKLNISCNVKRFFFKCTVRKGVNVYFKFFLDDLYFPLFHDFFYWKKAVFCSCV